jgi:predicted molibdopterin-dependent oxidoreductase YjgC
MAKETVRITIDGKPCNAEPGLTVLETAQAAGITIPSLCRHPRLDTRGRCRACLVEVEGRRGLTESCALTVSEGMVVRTDTEAVRAHRRMIVELLFARGGHDCSDCDASGRCALRTMAEGLGIEKPEVSFPAKTLPVDRSSEGIVRDPNRCIRCGRCVAACNGTVRHEVLGFGGRGEGTNVVSDLDLPLGDSSCVQCGECQQACPVGAIAPKRTVSPETAAPPRPAAAPRTVAAPPKKTRVTCPYCGVGCQIDLHMAEGKILFAEACEEDWEEMPNRGMLCVKGRFGLDFVHSRDRLRTPLIRRKGRLEEATWAEALDFTAERLGRIKTESGPDAIGFLASAKVTNEENYALTRFARAVIGTNNIDHCARL